jgi:hypothetical protein
MIMKTRLALFAVFGPVALAACSVEPRSEATDDPAEATASPDPLSPDEAMPAEEPTVEASDIAAAPASAIIPVALQGRWGLVPADCTTTRGDDKGLMKVNEKTIKFYESFATLGAINESGPTRLAARFAYEGEGMEWNRDLTMDVQDGGKTLVLREYGEDAPAGPRRYTRCS